MLQRLDPIRRLVSRFGPRKALGPLQPIWMAYAWTLPVIAVLGLVASTLEGVGIGLILPLLSALLSKNGVADVDSALLRPFLQFVERFDPSSGLAIMAGMILALMILKALVQILNTTFIAWSEGHAGNDIRNALSDRIFKLNYAFFLNHDPARLVNIVSSDAWRTADAVRLIYTIATSTMAVLVFSTLLMAVNIRLFLLVVAGVLIIRGAQSIYARRLRSLSVRVSSTNRDLAERMLASIMSMRLVRLFGAEERELARFAIASDGARQAMYDVQKASARMFPALEVMQSALFLFVLLVAHANGLSVPMIAAFLVLLYRMQPHLVAINQARLGLAALQGSIAEVAWLLGLEETLQSHRGQLAPPKVSRSIEFKDVSFRYPTREADLALSNLSMVLNANRSTAIIGRSGAGKSTIINLICGLIEPTGGSITVDGVDLTQLKVTPWRKRISLAGQDIDLVDGTIAENIAYGRPESRRDEIEKAARHSQAHEFIQALPEGYDTRVETRGLSLSGGQRQRIGLARALLRDPDILILDEATNAVDGISEQAIMALLQEYRRSRTTIVVSHRRSTLLACEDGIVIEGGRVVESGPLRDLKFFREMEQDYRADRAADLDVCQ